MRKENAIFFVSGLVFGVLVGYFVFQSLAQVPMSVSGGVAAANQPQSVPERRLVDPQEVAALERLAADNPDDAEVRIRIGALYLESGQYQQAAEWLRQATTSDEENLHARNHLAVALAEMGRFDEAISEYETALALDPSHPQSLFGLGRVLLYGKRDVQRGIAVWEKLIEVAPDSPEAQNIREEVEALKTAHGG
jgi:tetratricopeptide (TPR) repeat protein